MTERMTLILGATGKTGRRERAAGDEGPRPLIAAPKS
jgi:hypothetical protein